MISLSTEKYYAGRRLDLLVYEWDYYPIFNVLELFSYGCLFFLNMMQSFKFNCLTCYFSMDTSTLKSFPCRSYGWIVSTNYLATKIMQVSIFIGCCNFQVGASEEALIPHSLYSILLLPLYHSLWILCLCVISRFQCFCIRNVRGRNNSTYVQLCTNLYFLLEPSR